MKTSIEELQRLQFERKSWINSLLEITQKNIDAIALFKNTDNAYCIDLVAEKEILYKENLEHLVACNNISIPANAIALADLYVDESGKATASAIPQTTNN